MPRNRSKRLVKNSTPNNPAVGIRAKLKVHWTESTELSASMIWRCIKENLLQELNDLRNEPPNVHVVSPRKTSIREKRPFSSLEAITSPGNGVVVVRIRFEIISHRKTPANFYIYASLEADKGFKTIAREVGRFRREKFIYDTLYKLSLKNIWTLS